MSKRYKTRRDRLEAAIERAIALLDELDGDADKEPSLGSASCVGHWHDWFTPANFDQRKWAAPASQSDDREDEHDGREPDGDIEHHAQPPATPLVQYDGLRCAWSQGERIGK